jgi:hypothetical protein
MSVVGLIESLDWNPLTDTQGRFQMSGSIVGRLESMIDAVQEISRAYLKILGPMRKK